jgi:lysine 6-dehydrogenase
MGHVYAVLGAGRQGTAAAYDMAKFGDAERVLLGDKYLQNAKTASSRVNHLLKKEIAEPFQINVTNFKDLVRFLQPVDSFLSAVPYYHNLNVSKAAIKAKASMCDLGGNTDIVKQQLEMDHAAKEANISIIPDCGQVPGMGTSLCVYAMEQLDHPKEVYMWDGGLPQNPSPPFNYLLTFNIEGLTNEYAESTYFLRNGKLIEVQPFEELESIQFDLPIGSLEAFTTGGGTSTAPWTFQGKLEVYQNKTLRYPGHFSQLRAFWDLGLLDKKPIFIADREVIPREVFHALFEPKVRIPGQKDLVVIKILAKGVKDNKATQFTLTLIDYYDQSTGFTAMERTTGWDGSIIAIMMASGEIQSGARPVELAVPANAFLEELKRRGFKIDLRYD